MAEPNPTTRSATEPATSPPPTQESVVSIQPSAAADATPAADTTPQEPPAQQQAPPQKGGVAPVPPQKINAPRPGIPKAAKGDPPIVKGLRRPLTENEDGGPDFQAVPGPYYAVCGGHMFMVPIDPPAEKYVLFSPYHILFTMYTGYDYDDENDGATTTYRPEAMTG